jgi:regulator of microtubule dynamics RMD1/3-like protein
MRYAAPFAILALSAAPLLPLAAQLTIAQHIALGDSARAALHSEDALRHYQAAVALIQGGVGAQLEQVAGVHPTNPEFSQAFWKAAREIGDVAKQLLGDSLQQRRDSLYLLGRTWAEQAIAYDSVDANAHFALALVVGRLARTKSGKAKVRFGQLVYDETTRALQLDSTHDAAHHILGIWNDEVMRLSGIMKFFAKALFGGGFLDNASWAGARSHMEKAVALNPGNVYHRLELAMVYLDLAQPEPEKALEQLQAIAGLPDGDPMDPYYKRVAAEALADLRKNKIDAAQDRLHQG